MSSVEQVATTVTSTTMPHDVDPELLGQCVEYVQFQAYIGDADGLAIWERAGQSEDGLRMECRMLAAADEATVLDMRDEMRRLDAYFAAAEAASTMNTSSTTSTPPPAPPTTPQVVAPPAPPSDAGCDPNYTGCVPIAPDVDCAGGTGNGPAYARGPVQVVGNDIYGLDSDADGVGCE